MIVKGNHPLAEIIAKKLSGIQMCPPEEQRKMVNRACKTAVEWHEEIVKDAKNVLKIAASYDPEEWPSAGLKLHCIDAKRVLEKMGEEND